jgi:hypothetical protein
MSPKQKLQVTVDKNPAKAIAREMEEGLRDIVSLASALAFIAMGLPSQYQGAITIVADCVTERARALEEQRCRAAGQSAE